MRAEHRPLSSRARWLAWLGIGALALVLRTFWIDDPFWPKRGDFHGTFGAWALGGPARAMAEYGWSETGGLPYRWRLEFADGAVEHELYIHHPALLFLLTSAAVDLFGAEPWALRLVMLPFSLLLVLVGGLLGSRLFGERAGLVTALVLAVVPLCARDTMQVCTEAPVVTAIALVLLAYRRWLESGARRHLLAAAGWMVLGTLFDWLAPFVLPGLALMALVQGRLAREVRRAWPLYAAPLVAAGVHTLHAVAVLGWSGLRAESGSTLGYATSWVVSPADFARATWLHARVGFGAEVVALALLGMLLGLLGGRAGRDRFAWPAVAALPGVAYIMAFPFWGVTHGYLLFASALGMALGGAVAVRDLAGWDLATSTAGRCWLGVAACLSLAVAGAWRTTALVERARPPLDRPLWAEPWLAPILDDPRAVLISHQGRAYELPLHARAAVAVLDLDQYAEGEYLLERLPRLGPETPAYYLLDLQLGPLLPDYAAMRTLLERLGSSTEHDYPGGPFLLFELETGPDPPR